ncbi:MAG: rhodanese-like domain-containing protein [Arcobacteraceae bacterium]
MKVLYILLLPLLAFSDALLNLPYIGFEVLHTKKDGSKVKVVVQREVPPECIDLPMSSEIFWSSRYAASEVPPLCKKEFVTTKGIIQPIAFNDKIKTVGELEVLDFIKNKVSINPKEYMLVDSRPKSWYDYFTIPTAVNVPYDEMEKDEMFMEEYLSNLKKLGIVDLGNGKFDVSGAKTIILFCNGAWCSQSNKAMNILIKMGYPQEKIMWYRGGIQSWLNVNLTVVNN